MQAVFAPNIELLFQEFMRRYRELQAAKRLETLWFASAVLLGVAVVCLPWVFPDKGLVSAGAVLIFLYITVRKYMRQTELVNHLSVNVHILHHHLLGKLEVGFCTHTSTCNCAEEFRQYVWHNYRISLYGGSLEERY